MYFILTAHTRAAHLACIKAAMLADRLIPAPPSFPPVKELFLMAELLVPRNDPAE